MTTDETHKDGKEVSLETIEELSLHVSLAYSLDSPLLNRQSSYPLYDPQFTLFLISLLLLQKSHARQIQRLSSHLLARTSPASSPVPSPSLLKHLLRLLKLLFPE